jgi:hypothetical protein
MRKIKLIQEKIIRDLMESKDYKLLMRMLIEENRKLKSIIDKIRLSIDYALDESSVPKGANK